MNSIVSQGIAAGISYAEYRGMIDYLLAENKTTGPNQSEQMIEYTRLNVTRMSRLDKTTIILEEVRQAVVGITTPQTWLVITEAWCGDAAQIVPVINRMAELNPAVTLKHVLRDENSQLMDLFLTNGGKSIPIIVVIDDAKREVIGHWGPRPAELQRKVMVRNTDSSPLPYSEFVVELQKWYAQDKTVSIQREFVALQGKGDTAVVGAAASSV